MTNNVELNKQELRNVAKFLVVTGIIGRPDEQNLLPVPAEVPVSRTNFDTKLEVQYLSRLPEELRMPQLKKEVVTVLAEMKFAEVNANYEMRNGRVVDSDTGQDLEELIARGNIPAETVAIRKINSCLSDDSDRLVVNISPKDMSLGYGDNVVDIWRKYPDGKVKVLRYRTAGNLETFRGFYKNIGGEIDNPTKSQILSDPVQINNLRLSDIMDLLVVEKCEERFDSADINRVADKIMREFNRKFGDRLVSDPDVILRYYLAVKDAVEKLGDKSIRGGLERIIMAMPMEKYLNSNFTVRTEGGSHCGAGVSGEFGQSGWILVINNGRMESYYGSTVGMTYCEHCGCWHSELQCPYCDLHYESNC